jgi:sodium/potassium-transporting ATPase subunit beta
VSCEGQTPAIAELIGPIQYLPLPGFPAYYFPYDNSEHFMSPLVALSFEKPQSKLLIYNLLHAFKLKRQIVIALPFPLSACFHS